MSETDKRIEEIGSCKVLDFMWLKHTARQIAIDLKVCREYLKDRCEDLAFEYNGRIKAEKEIDRLEEDKTRSFCVYCEQEYPPGSTYDDLKKHVHECPEHPLKAALNEIDILRAEARGFQHEIDGLKKELGISEAGRSLNRATIDVQTETIVNLNRWTWGR